MIDYMRDMKELENKLLKLKLLEKENLELKEQLKQEYQKLKKDYNLLDTTMESDDRIICQLLNHTPTTHLTVLLLVKGTCLFFHIFLFLIRINGNLSRKKWSN